MKIETIGTVVRIVAESGMAIRRKNSASVKSTIAEVWLVPTDSPDNWEDCEYGKEEYMKYSVRSIIRELKSINKFTAVRSLLETANYDWDFIGSNYLSSNDTDFQTMMAAIVSQGILTQAELDTLLPKCIWEQTPMV